MTKAGPAHETEPRRVSSLRRLAQSARNHDWFSAGVELAIVVLGVFLGLQASNWNNELQVRASERPFLVRLQTDLAADVASGREKMAYLQQVADAGTRTLSFMRGNGTCGRNCWRVLVDYFIASQWRDLSSQRGVLEELRASPYPYDQGLKRELVGYYSTVNQTAQVAGPPDYRRLVRSYIPVEVQVRLWSECHHGGGDHQVIVPDCAAPISNDEAREIVNGLKSHADLEPTLTYYTGALIGVLLSQRTELQRGDRLVARLGEVAR